MKQKIFILFSFFFLTSVAFAQSNSSTASSSTPRSVAAPRILSNTTAKVGVSQTYTKSNITLPSCESLFGSKIRQVQEALIIAGYDVGIPDNTLNPRTRQALIHFQKDKGLPAGNLNMETLKALEKVLVEKGVCSNLGGIASSSY